MCPHLKRLQERQLLDHNAAEDPTREFLYFKLPYIYDEFNAKVRRLFKKEDLLFASRTTTLRQALISNIEKRESTRNGCSMANSNLCMTKNIVYKITCTKCGTVMLAAQ